MEILYPLEQNKDTKMVFTVGPALFGPDLGTDIADVSGELYILPGEAQEGGGATEVGKGCGEFSETDADQSKGKIVLIARGGCLFIDKVYEGVTLIPVPLLFLPLLLHYDNTLYSGHPSIVATHWGTNFIGVALSRGLICTIRVHFHGTQQSGLYRGVSSRQGWPL